MQYSVVTSNAHSFLSTMELPSVMSKMECLDGVPSFLNSLILGSESILEDLRCGEVPLFVNNFFFGTWLYSEDLLMNR